ncbi:hypothetical protein QQP08_025285 [Theobroma cacao]|nr:hypothetical protein QQP08_025285 [Theobroma cacao]
MMVDSRATTGWPLDKASETSADTLTKAFEFVGRRWLLRFDSLFRADDDADDDDEEDAIFPRAIEAPLRCGAMRSFYGASKKI